MKSAETPIARDFKGFDHHRAARVVAEVIEAAYERVTVKPELQQDKPSVLEPLPAVGMGFDGFRRQMAQYSAASCGLASPAMIGHMDTAAHPLAAYSDAVVSALNNNLLFRELSPQASVIEEHMLSELANRLGLHDDWHGTFASGGSIANLTALFAATGGFDGVANRHKVALFVPECAHTSVLKSAAVLGIDSGRIHRMASDEQGRAETQAVFESLQKFRRDETDGKAIVVAVLGSTVHGAVELVDELAAICEEFSAWLHVDAIYGAALAFSHSHKKLLAGLDRANSVVAGPQKWMFVPRVSAMLWVKEKAVFDATLAFANSYSANTETHRGTWGLQGSRRADAMTLWAVLNYVGTDAVGQEVDNAIATTRLFYQKLVDHPAFQPSHKPDLNLQCFCFRDATRQPDAAASNYRQLGTGDVPWVSIGRWRENDYFRAVLLSPQLSSRTVASRAESNGTNGVLDQLLDVLS